MIGRVYRTSGVGRRIAKPSVGTGVVSVEAEESEGVSSTPAVSEPKMSATKEARLADRRHKVGGPAEGSAGVKGSFLTDPKVNVGSAEPS